MSIKQLIKDWTLPISMMVGVLGYFLFTQVEALSNAKRIIASTFPYFLPGLICVMLFFTYCKIEPRELRPRRWHLWLILIQLCEVILGFLWCMANKDSEWLPLGEALLACFIAPMAAVGAVVTQKIGGNPATATTYTIISSTFTAIVVPVVYPLVEPGLELSFFDLFLRILSRVFPTIMAPLVITLILWKIAPKIKDYVAEKSKDYSFYLWALCTIVNTAQIIKSIVSSPSSGTMVLWICLSVGILVFAQFYLGKTIGSIYNDRMAAGQGLAQKNTVLAIWMAMSFLTPQSAIGPGACLLWQNIFNSWQIWDHNRKV
ncbi:MAG: transporter [Bacteroidales bacterium]|nr:transporter [Bacteroidales bacterium]